MRISKLALLATAPAIALAAIPATVSAQDAGAMIYSQEDTPTEVGTVVSNDGTTVVVDTGKHKAPLPGSLFAEREGKWTINATKAQLNGLMDQQVAQAEAARDAALVEGASVMSADGTPAGMIYTIDSEDVVILKNEAGIVTLTRESFAADANGQLIALYTSAQLAANTTAVPEGAEILTPAQARAKEEAEMTASANGEGATGASM